MPIVVDRPTGAEYDTALREALRAADVDPGTIEVLAAEARRERIAHGINDHDCVPRVPGKGPRAKNSP